MTTPMPVGGALREQLGAHSLVRERKTFDINREVHVRGAIQAAWATALTVDFSKACLARIRRCAELDPTERPFAAASFEQEASFLVAEAENMFINQDSLYTELIPIVDSR